MDSTLNIPNVIGVKNSRVKKWLAEQTPIHIIQIAPEAAGYDCVRHIDFLKYWKYDKENIRKSIYWQYTARTKGNKSEADAKCEYFGGLFDSVCANGWNGAKYPIAITNDGIRLDGSHRSAMATVLGITSIHAAVYSWKQVPFWNQREASELQKEAISKRIIYEAVKLRGDSVISRKNGVYLGRFIHVETKLQDVGLLPQKLELIVMVEKPDGEFAWLNWNDIRVS